MLPKKYILFSVVGSPLSEKDFENAKLLNKKLAITSDKEKYDNFTAKMQNHLEEPAVAGKAGRSSTRLVKNRWPNGVVPYTLEAAFNDEFKALIAAAILAVQDATCIQWRPKVDTDKDWVYIQTTGAQGCTATLGFAWEGFGEHALKLKGPDSCNQKVTIFSFLIHALCIQGVIIHEMMHNLGVSHEMQRPERDDFISMVWPNVQLAKADQYYRDSYDGETMPK